MEEEPMDWIQEAQAVIQDVGFALKDVAISSLESPGGVHINMQTHEGQSLCVELSCCGFRVVGDKFDSSDKDFSDKTYYETPYALLDKYSPEFRQCFAAALHKKLSELEN